MGYEEERKKEKRKKALPRSLRRRIVRDKSQENLKKKRQIVKTGDEIRKNLEGKMGKEETKRRGVKKPKPPNN